MVKFIHPKRGSANKSQPRSPLIGQVFSGSVTGLGAQGQGILTHSNGQKVFVSGAWPGEQVKVKITEVKKQLAFAQLLEVEQAHPERIAPPCPYHGIGNNDCGGCAWMFMAYPAQLQAKQTRVVNALTKMQVASERINHIHPSPDILAYRNRAQFKTDGKQLGFFANASQQLVDINICKVLIEPLQHTLTQLRAELPNPNWHNKRGQMTTLDVDEQTLSVNKRLPFQQGNHAQNVWMQAWLKSQFETLNNSPVVLELFAGSGNFTEVLAQTSAKHIYAVEAVLEATDALNQKNLAHVETITADLFQLESVQALAKKAKQTQVLVLDPPRDGFKWMGELCQGLKQLQQVFYISCDLATFCRDIAALQKLGFHSITVQPLDLFPHTPHVELVAHCQKGKP